jgi:two-component system, sensor histidine kinase
MSDTLDFAPESGSDAVGEPWKMLIVDDDDDVHAVTMLALRDFRHAGRGLQFLHAHDGRQARQVLRDHGDVAVVLLDVVMETDQAGLEVVDYVRNVLNNRRVRIVLRTGQPGSAPENEVVQQHAINDYRHKTELTRERLATTVHTALAAYAEVTSLDASEEMQRVRRETLKLARTRSELLNNVSHEVRTPMNGVLGMSQVLMLDETLTREQRQAAEIVQVSAQSLQRLMEDVLDLQQIEQGLLRLDVVDFELRDVIQRAADAVVARARAKGLRLKHAVAEAVPAMLQGDPRRVGQVLTHLLSNAAKFTASGEIELSAVVDSETASETTLRITVRDTGPGISAEVQRELFQPFRQADSSFTRQHGGLGLGLAICRELVDLMGGGIGVQSEPGRGACFWFTICLPKSTRVVAPALTH